jgi:ketosteroid isomerase-like protein
MNTDFQIMAELDSFIEKFIKAYPKDNVDDYLALFLKNEDLVMFGTGEKWVGWEDYKSAPQADKDKFEDISIKFDWKKLNYHGQIAWVAAEVTVSLIIEGQKVSVPARITSVLKKQGDDWLITQGHISSPDTG